MVNHPTDEVRKLFYESRDSKDAFTQYWFQRWIARIQEKDYEPIHDPAEKPWMANEGIYMVSPAYILDHLEAGSLMELLSNSERRQWKESRMMESIDNSLEKNWDFAQWDPILISCDIEREVYLIGNGMTRVRAFYKRDIPLVRADVSNCGINYNSASLLFRVMAENYPRDLFEVIKGLSSS